MLKDLEQYKINSNLSIRDSFRVMDTINSKIMIVVDNNSEVIGIVTDGDLRRSIWNDVELSNSVMSIVNIKYIFLNKTYRDDRVKDIFSDVDINVIPVIDDNKLIGLVFREEMEDTSIKKSLVGTSVVIMAGGKGTRMDPFTRILPKPLIPIGNHPIVRVIMDKFGEYGVVNFHLSLNDKARMVKGYFHDHELSYKINFIEESIPLGTAGGLKYLSEKITKPFFVSNCDIIINSDYASIMEFHNSGKYDLTIIGSIRNYVIPYGICEVDSLGELVIMREKPEQDFLVNTGLYVLNPNVLDLIPSNEYYDMNQLINTLQEKKMKIGVYPISEKAWMDIGQWAEYKKTMDDIGVINNVEQY
jgi:dTDP-glucose pyrophosphorylase